MLLASFVRDRKAELRADFQQFYGLNIDAMGRGYTIRHAADLAAMLPSASRTFVSIDPENAWTLQDRILARIEYWCHVSAWMQTKDGGEHEESVSSRSSDRCQKWRPTPQRRGVARYLRLRANPFETEKRGGEWRLSLPAHT